MKITQIRASKCYLFSLLARKSATITCVGQTYRQTGDYRSFIVEEREGSRYTLMRKLEDGITRGKMSYEIC